MGNRELEKHPIRMARVRLGLIGKEASARGLSVVIHTFSNEFSIRVHGYLEGNELILHNYITINCKELVTLPL